MSFSEELNKYIKTIGCNGRQISKLSGIQEPIISKYRKGSSIPKYKSEQLEKIIKSLALLALDNNIDLSEDIIRNDLEKYLEKDSKIKY